jgi:cell division protein FtsA
MPGSIGEYQDLSRIQLKEDNTLFALDIGTRTVIGIVAGVEGSSLRILAQVITEHESRAVFDGQIHDIFKVAQAVRRVKNELEEQLGFKLNKAAIAAAGRALKTRYIHIEQEIGDDIEIDPMICRGLEMDAVSEAYRQLGEETGNAGEEEFYCVGYTVVNYYLNSYTITSLIGHRGRKAGVDVLATFLPNSVVNSLFTVLERVNLESISLTLEPIAAASAIIPESYRLLNLALIDIGAGTSDIAITRDGSIVAYGMVPMAGDELTEALAQGCLADFYTAENIKRQIVRGGDITFHDIMGIEKTLSCADALEMLDPVLESLADRVTAEILRLNGNKPPKSVFCVGGGGQVPTLTGRIARKLDLVPERVGLRSRNHIPGLICGGQEISGPEGVTVVGIARVALDTVGHNFINININGKDCRLFHSRELTVFDALGLIGYNPGGLIGKNGRDLRFVLNGERKTIFGGLGKPAEVFINGEPANLKCQLGDGDVVTVSEAVRGEDARACISDFTGDFRTISLNVNGQDEVFEPQCFIDGKQVSPGQEITDGNRVDIVDIRNVMQLAKFKGIDLCDYEALVNGKESSGESVLANGDSVQFITRAGTAPAGPLPVEGTGLGTGVRPPEKIIEITVNNEKVTLTGKSGYIFVDIFNHIDIERVRAAAAGKIMLLLNGRRAGYTDPVKDGDVIEIYWE